MKLTRIILLAALLLATGTTASAKKPSRLEKYKQTIMQYLEQKPFYLRAHNSNVHSREGKK